MTDRVADYQGAKHAYLKSAKLPANSKYSQEDLDRGFVVSGLWSWSRHPNFAAEQAIWFMRAIEAAARGHSDPIGIAARRIGLDRSHFERWTDWSTLADTELADVVRPNFSDRPRTNETDDRQTADVTLLHRRRTRSP